MIRRFPPPLLVTAAAALLLASACSGDKPAPEAPTDTGATVIGTTSSPAPSTSVTPGPRPAVSDCAPATLTPPPATAAPIAGAYRLARALPEVTFDDGVKLAPVPGTAGEAVVARLNGELWRVSLDGSFPPAIFGDLDPIVETGGEEGLLSLAFSPRFPDDPSVYVYYTRGSPRPSVLSRFQAGSEGLDESTEEVILTVPQPYANHNGGDVLFGHDCMLYLSLGDGGGGGDPTETGQDNSDLLGSVLRLDVLGGGTYAVPSDNPFAGARDPGNDLVWAYGLRNPWRMSADCLTGEIWLGDVGQKAWEEVDRIVRGGNFGWDCREAFAEYETADCHDETEFVPPRAAYKTGSNGNRAVAGGYVYRGAAFPELYGYYVYADSYSGRIWAVDTAGNGDPVELLRGDDFIYGFSELDDGELLVLTAGAMYGLQRR